MKSLLILFISLFIGFSSLSQDNKINFGFELGIIKPKVISNIDIFTYPDTPFRPSASLLIAKNLNKRWSITVGLGYLDYKFESENNYQVINPRSDDYFNSEVKSFSFLSIPLRVKRNFKNIGFFYSASLTNKILIDHYIYLENTLTKNNETIARVKNKYALAIDADFGYEYSISRETILFTSIRISADIIDAQVGRIKGYYHLLVIPAIQIGCLF